MGGWSTWIDGWVGGGWMGGCMGVWVSRCMGGWSRNRNRTGGYWDQGVCWGMAGGWGAWMGGWVGVWDGTDMFEKLKTEQKFTPIYSPQCNGRIEDFHKFLKATIAKQLETCVEWDDLVWKATAAYNFFPMESSGMAPFFLMFGREAAVKHTLLQSESPKYLGTDDGMMNIELMNKLYMVVVHNLNQARKARDRNKKNRTVKEPEKLKFGDNVLVRDHTSKAFQPKYKDFCIIGVLGKNQVEVKDNHGHTSKVHCRDVKKIPMTEKICQLYEEEQVGKVREGRKAVPANKMPELGWDIAETDIQTIPKKTQPDNQQTLHTFKY